MDIVPDALFTHPQLAGRLTALNLEKLIAELKSAQSRALPGSLHKGLRFNIQWTLGETKSFQEGLDKHCSWSVESYKYITM